MHSNLTLSQKEGSINGRIYITYKMFGIKVMGVIQNSTCSPGLFVRQ